LVESYFPFQQTVCPASATGTNLNKFFDIIKFMADKTLINMIV